MATLQLQNRTRNPYKVPLGKGEIDNSGARMIAPGMIGEIDADKHAQLMKANKAYGSMIEQGKLKASPVVIEEVNSDELEFTADAEIPADLLENPEAEGAEGAIAATVESKSVEMVTAPADDLTPAQKGAATRAAKKANRPAQV
tara:strand:- start:1417 stop:1848 length:432 start_codon:yes stop_codon:yes gene_type:complete